MNNGSDNNREEFGDKDRLSALDDWSLLDIATGPDFSSEDSLDAQATIKERQEAGTFNADNEQTISTEDDLYNHNYGIMDGKILAPAPGYRNENEEVEEKGESRNQAIGEAAVYGFDEFGSNSVKIGTKQQSDGDRKKEKNPNIENKEEMREAEKSKYNEQEIREKTQRFTDFLEQPIKRWKFRGRRYENNRYYLPTERDKIIDMEARKDGVPKVESLDERANNAIEYAKWRLRKKNAVQQMYTEGALDRISDGDFSLNPGFIYDGLKSLYGKEIDKRAGLSKEEVWDSIHFDGILPRVETSEQLDDLEKHALEDAIELGVIESREGILGEKMFKTALPIGLVGEKKINDILMNYGIVIDNSEIDKAEEYEEQEERNIRLYEKFESGFVNIIDAIKNDISSEEGFGELEWYFEKMLLVVPVEDEIADRVLNAYEAGSNDAFIAKFSQFMEWRKQNAKRVSEKEEGDFEGAINQKDSATLDFISGNEDEVIFPNVGPGTAGESKGGFGWIGPENYGLKKLQSFNEHLAMLEQLPGFEMKRMTYSKPFYLRRVSKNVADDDGTTKRIVHYESIPAHFDEEKQEYISDITGNTINSKNIRRYKSAYFSINGVDIAIKEGITDMSAAMYIIIGEYAAAPDLPAFHGSMSEAIETVRQNRDIIFKKNHCKFDKDGVIDYHNFEKMWNQVFEDIFRIIKSMNTGNVVA